MYVSEEVGEIGYASEWVPKNGKILELRDCYVTQKTETKVPTMVFVKKRGMKEAWQIASSIKYRKEYVIKLYNRRFTCEENFRDLKDDRYGSGLKETIVTSTDRRDRLILIHALTVAILTLLGAVGEKLKYDLKLKANTSKKRTHSLYRQGREYIKGVMNVYVVSFKSIFLQLIENQQHITENLSFI